MQQFKGVNDHFMALAGIYKIYVGILKLLQEDDLTENTRLKQSSWMKGTKNVKRNDKLVPEECRAMSV